MNKKLFLILFGLLPALAVAQSASLKEVAQKAVLNNPEVQSKWHAFRAAEEEAGAARGGFLPRVDLTVGAGRETLKQPLASEVSYSRRGYVLSLNQMIFDGFATSNDVKRLGKAKLTRYFELLDASEGVALEAARAYLDVMRYRFLVSLAEDNYVQHKATYEQLVRRTQSGVGRRADMEQAGSRLALAEVNLTTEIANLHDVTARYQRIVGEQPPKVAFAGVQLGRSLPDKASAALERAFRSSPALLAAIENVEAALYDADIRRAAFLPRLELRARTDNTNNYQGIDGDRKNNVVEMVLNYNLFNGGSDLARQRQYAERLDLARDLREKACRDVRQTLAIAFNDVGRLREQGAFVETQVNLLERTRDAYRDQFNVGQRTLLDLLDTENELLTARRSAINADADLSLAYLRSYAGMGGLLEFLGLKKLETGGEPAADQLAQVDPKVICPNEAPLAPAFDRAALNARALALIEETAKAGLPQGMLSGPGVAASKIEVVPIGIEAEVSRQINAWVAAWVRKDVAAYLAFYSPAFSPDGGLSREDWMQMRQERIGKPKEISVEIQDMKVRPDGATKAVVEFHQLYRSDRFRDTSYKILELGKQDGKWLILRESAAPVVGKK